MSTFTQSVAEALSIQRSLNNDQNIYITCKYLQKRNGAIEIRQSSQFPYIIFETFEETEKYVKNNGNQFAKLSYELLFDNTWTSLGYGNHLNFYDKTLKQY